MNNLKTRLKNIGPGALVAAAFIGPGTVTSCSTSGANYGYTLLWAMLLSVISVIIMQSMAARLGIVSKMGLGQALREKFQSKPARILLAILVISAVFIGNIAYETGNISGSVLGVQSAIPALGNQTAKIVLALIIGIAAFVLLWSGSYKYIEKILTALVVIMGVVFFITAFAAKPNWGAVFKGLFGFQVPDGSSWMTIAALMGTTVVPYNIYLHASSAAKKWSADDDVAEGLANSRLDSIISIGLGGLISMAIIICAGATMNVTGTKIPVVKWPSLCNHCLAPGQPFSLASVCLRQVFLLRSQLLWQLLLQVPVSWDGMKICRIRSSKSSGSSLYASVSLLFAHWVRPLHRLFCSHRLLTHSCCLSQVFCC